MSMLARSTRSVTHSLSGPQSFEKGTWRRGKGPRAERKARRKEWNRGEVTRVGAQVRFHRELASPPSPFSRIY